MATPNVVFAFGPNNGFFFEVNGARKWHRIPKLLEKMFEDGDRQDGSKIVNTSCIALTEDGGFVITYEVEGGKYRLDNEGGPSDLIRWITRESNYLLETVKFSIEYNNSFFVVGQTKPTSKMQEDNDKSGDNWWYRWRGVPPELETYLQTHLANRNLGPGYVWLACLGSKEDYFVYEHPESDPDNECDWDFHGVGASSLVGYLPEESLRGCYIVLDPYALGHYFVIPGDGTIRWNVDRLHTAAVKELAEKYIYDRSEEGFVCPSKKRRLEEDYSGDTTIHIE